MSTQKTISDIYFIFTTEFSNVADRFIIKQLTFEQAETSYDPDVARGGVYVWWKDDRVYKVGRSLENSRKRALEHIRDNTGEKMAGLKNDPGTRLILFNIKNKGNLHWVIALEDFFEQKLEPVIQVKRRG
ncbi:hypothetical protein ES703_105659 [subsurface metagenome]